MHRPDDIFQRGYGQGVVTLSRKAVVLIFAVVAMSLNACGNGKSSDDEPVDRITINMSPLHVIGFNDDHDGTLYPAVLLGTLPAGQNIFIRVRDPYGQGDFYSIQVSNNSGGPPHVAVPMASDGEPDDLPIDAKPIPYANYVTHRGLSPVGDEDWFEFTSGGESVHLIATLANAAGASADPVLEIYDARLNPGPITYSENLDRANDLLSVGGIYDPMNDLSLIGYARSDSVGTLHARGSFLIIFSGPASPGSHSIRFATPPLTSSNLGSVTGTMHVDEYGEVGGRVSGRFDLTIEDGSRTTTVNGSFNLTRDANQSGLLTGFRAATASRVGVGPADALKRVYAYFFQPPPVQN